MDGLSKGVYLALYQGEFFESNPERKLVFSVYSSQPINTLGRVEMQEYPSDAVDAFEQALMRKMQRQMISAMGEDLDDELE